MSENYERFGNFILLEKLNSGGMAEVFLAKSLGANGVNKFFAIKRILPQFADNREFIDMFKEEAKIAVNLDHGNVVSIIDFKAAQNQLYLVMDYVQGQNLRQLLQQKKKKNLELNLPFIVYIIREVAAGMDHAHKCVDKASGKSLNIIHRDMSPQNVMVSYDGEVKVVDFGIAKAETAGDSTRVGTLKGKFSYMSPEQAEGLIVDQTTDIFSIGIILWELLADDRLFVANNEFNILKRIKECDIPDIRRVLPTIPLELEKIVKKTLMKDKTQRYQSANELLRDLTRFLNKEYPDFTRNDFSTFMKFLFEDEYRFNQNQLVKYAKVQTEAPAPGGPPDGTFTAIAQSNDGAPKGLLQQGEAHSGHTNSLIKINGVPNNPSKPLIISNGEAINKSTVNDHKKPNISQVFQKPTGTTKTLNSNNASGNYNYTKSGGTLGSSSQVRFQKKKKNSMDSIVRTLSVILIILSLGSGFVYFKGLKVPGIQNSANLKDLTRPSKVRPPEPTQPIEMASNGKYTVLVQSNPGKARVYLNSVDTGLFTPASVEVTPNLPFNITLLADGYLPYNGRFTATVNGQKLTATLYQISLGYVNIKVVNGGVDTVVFVNGLRLTEKPPISRYPVAAGTPVKIRAEAPFTNAFAETSVTVGKDEKTDVELILSNNPDTH